MGGNFRIDSYLRCHYKYRRALQFIAALYLIRHFTVYEVLNS